MTSLVEWTCAKALPYARFLYSPSNTYPMPHAYMIDRRGHILHQWTHSVGQPDKSTCPPRYLRGWNHVELGADGSLLAIVPFDSLIKLDSSSRLVWRAAVAAHHDMAQSSNGEVLVLAEVPRLVKFESFEGVILDNEIAVIDAHGVVRVTYSLFDLFVEDVDLAGILATRLNRERCILSDPRVKRLGLRTVPSPESKWRGSQSSNLDQRALITELRSLPNSAADILHCNSLTLLSRDCGQFKTGQVVISVREMNRVVVVDLDMHSVVWSWGADSGISGQHHATMPRNGKLLLFDNGVARRRSRVILVDTLSGHVDWVFGEGDDPYFYSEKAGGCELLPNGNYLVSIAQSGFAFEVSESGAVTWHWRLPTTCRRSTDGRVGIYRLSYVPRCLANFS
jgi:hypothetical protein